MRRRRGAQQGCATTRAPNRIWICARSTWCRAAMRPEGTWGRRGRTSRRVPACIKRSLSRGVGTAARHKQAGGLTASASAVYAPGPREFMERTLPLPCPRLPIGAAALRQHVAARDAEASTDANLLVALLASDAAGGAVQGGSLCQDMSLSAFDATDGSCVAVLPPSEMVLVAAGRASRRSRPLARNADSRPCRARSAATPRCWRMAASTASCRCSLQPGQVCTHATTSVVMQSRQSLAPPSAALKSLATSLGHEATTARVTSRWNISINPRPPTRAA